jgi:glutamyl-tRNA synthetase
MDVRVRYAPSPTGTLHIGGARTALFNYLFARRHGGVMILRIEDTDQEREVPGSTEAIMRDLRFLGIEWEEGPDVGGPRGPYRQSERLAWYREAVERLERADLVYRCYCTPTELERVRAAQRARGEPPRYPGTCRHLSAAERLARTGQPYVLRFKVPAGEKTVVHDLVRGDVVFDHAVLDDFVVQKSDGMPVYNFAVVVDDAAMAVSHVIRGEEHLSNTPKQLLVARALGVEPPQYAHVPMILAPDRSKLSKRHGATSVGEYREAGILPEALTNYLALLGWSPPDGAEFFSLEEAARVFDLDRVQRTAAIYDVRKLEWMNGQYLRRLPLGRVVEAVRPFLAACGIDWDRPPVRPAVDPEGAVQLVRERARTLVELAEALRFLYQPISRYDPDGVAKHFTPETAGYLERLADALLGLTEWTAPALDELFARLAETWQVPRARLIHPTRLALTGRTVGPGLFELMAALGPAESQSRLRQAAAWIHAGRDAAGVTR